VALSNDYMRLVATPHIFILLPQPTQPPGMVIMMMMMILGNWMKMQQQEQQQQCLT